TSPAPPLACTRSAAATPTRRCDPRGRSSCGERLVRPAHAPNSTNAAIIIQLDVSLVDAALGNFPQAFTSAFAWPRRAPAAFICSTVSMTPSWTAVRVRRKAAAAVDRHCRPHRAEKLHQRSIGRATRGVESVAVELPDGAFHF